MSLFGKVRDPAVIRAYLEAHPTCEVCGGRDCGNWQLGCHHLIGGAARSDEPCNLLAVGWSPCHQRMEISSTSKLVVNGVRYPAITLYEQLQIKRRTGLWVPERLAELRGQALPEAA